MLHRTHRLHDLIAQVVVLPRYGCPAQATVTASGLDERTVQGAA